MTYYWYVKPELEVDLIDNHFIFDDFNSENMICHHCSQLQNLALTYHYYTVVEIAFVILA